MHVAVIGAGVFGTWTSHHLLASGASVTLIDAYGPGNSRSSSGDETRILRCGYGHDRVYSELALRSLEQWRELDAIEQDARVGRPFTGRVEAEGRPFAGHVEAVGRPFTGRRIWHGCGVIWISSPGDPYFTATVAILRNGPYAADVLTRDEILGRYPDFRVGDDVVALLEPECGILMARRSVQTLAVGVARRGARIVHGRAVMPGSGAPIRTVALSDGETIEADAFVFACGGWLAKVFPELLAGRIRPTRQVLVYFGTPPGDDRFTSPRFPAWIMGTSVYGTPDVEGRGVKVGIHEPGPPMDPDADDRLVDAKEVEIARAWLARHIPALEHAPVVESRVCQYENTDTGDFLIDRHPAHDNVWIVGGGSGHGFKHGPAVGELVARLVTTGADTEPRFALAARTAETRRAVY